MFDVFFYSTHTSIAVLALDIATATQAQGITDISQAGFHSVMIAPGDVPHPNPPPKLSSIAWQSDTANSDATSHFSTMIFAGDIPLPPNPPKLTANPTQLTTLIFSCDFPYPSDTPKFGTMAMPGDGPHPDPPPPK